MRTGSKVRFFKNKNRNEVEKSQPYVPQYQTLGLEPVEYKSAIVPHNLPKTKPSTVNPRDKRSLIRQPYAVVQGPQIGSGRNVIPNVGNNVEQTWSSVDGEIIDDLNIDPNQEMIDNNDFTPDSSSLEESEDDFQESSSNDLLEVLEELEDTSYLLLVKGVPICSGPKNDIEDQVQALIFGEHVLCDGEPVSREDIMIFKKLSLKICAITE